MFDVDPDDSKTDDGFRDYVDERLAELQLELGETDDRLDDQGARQDAISRKLDAVRETADAAQDRAERAERMAAWGGAGYADRLARVVDVLAVRARNNPAMTGGPEGHTTFYADEITPTEQDRDQVDGTRPGVVDVLDGAVSDRTARNYVRDLADCAGLSLRDATRGGWGGGSEQMRLRMDLDRFTAAYGSDWSIDDLLADMGDD